MSPHPKFPLEIPIFLPYKSQTGNWRQTDFSFLHHSRKEKGWERVGKENSRSRRRRERKKGCSRDFLVFHLTELILNPVLIVSNVLFSSSVSLTECSFQVQTSVTELHILSFMYNKSLISPPLFKSRSG